MNCANHTQTPATAYCRTCGKPLCAGCQRIVNGVIYCEQCIAERLGNVPPVPPAAGPTVGQVVMDQGLGMPPGTEPGHTPSPGLAAVLGFIPGVGAIYNGQFVKGIAHVAIFIALIFAANNLPDSIAWIPGLGIAFWVFYMVYDAYQTARARELGRPLPDPFGFENLWEGGRQAYSSRPSPVTPATATGFASSEATAVPGSAAAVPGAPFPPGTASYAPPDYASRPAAPVGAIVLIALGTLFLLGTVWNFSWWFNRYWLPAALIAFGIWIFFRKRSRPWACPCSRCLARSAMGPAMLITTGALWLLHETTRWTFDRSWPIYLIVIGGILVLRHSASEEGHIPYSERLDHLGRHVDDRIRSRMEKQEMARDFFRQRVENRDSASPPSSTGAAPERTNDEVHNG